MYKDGVYRPDGEIFIQEQAQIELGDYFSTHRVNEILNFVRYSTYVSRNSFDTDKNIINLENVLLNIEKNEYKEHTPKYFSLVRIPAVYHPSAQCPNIEQFLSEVLNEEDIPLIEELFGFCLLSEYRFHKAFMFQGTGRNGKSTLLNLLQRFLGISNCSNVDLTALCNESFCHEPAIW